MLCCANWVATRIWTRATEAGAKHVFMHSWSLMGANHPAVCSVPMHVTRTHTLLICSLPGLKADKHVVMLQVKDKPQWGWECVSVNILIYTLKPACSTANKNMSMYMLWGNLISFILSSFFLPWVQGPLGYFLLTAIRQPIRRIIDECQQVSTVLLNQGVLESLINALKHFSWYFCLINGNNFPPICYF